MVSSPPHSSPSPGGRRSTQGGGQLLQELEALSQALHHAQRRSMSQPPPQPQPQPPPPKKIGVSSFLSRRETMPARAPSFQEPSAYARDPIGNEPIPVPGSASPAKRSPFSLGSRHSLSVPQPAIGERADKAASPRPRFSTSTALQQQQQQQQPSLVDAGEKSEIRARYDRRLSLQPWHSQDAEKSIPEVTDLPAWIEESADFSRKLETPLEKKKSIWNWKPLRALSHIGQKRFHCVFSAHIHAAEGLPPAMNGLRLAVHWRKKETKEGAVQTMPSRVFQGIAEFEEIMYMKCTLYGSKSPSHGFKFMSKLFILSVIAPDVEELDLGKHQLDLSPLLANFMDEKQGDHEKLGSWNTSFDLSGKARGGKLVVTFNYEIVDNDSLSLSHLSSGLKDSPPHRGMRTSYSLPNSAHGTPRTTTARANMNSSPCVSDPCDEMNNFLSMDHLSLDEPSPVAYSGELVRKVDAGTKVPGFPAFRPQIEKPPHPGHEVFHSFSQFDPTLKSFSQFESALEHLTPKQLTEGLDNSKDIGYARRTADDEDSSEDEGQTDFVVVEKGVEVNEPHDNDLNERRATEELDSESEEDDLDKFNPQLSTQKFEDGGKGVESDEKVRNEMIIPEEEMESVDKFTIDQVEITADDSDSEVHPSKTPELQEKQSENKDGKEKDSTTSTKETVTAQMVLLTLENLIQGTTAREKSHLEMNEETADVEDDTKEASPEVRPKEASPEVRREEEPKLVKGEESLDNETDLVAGEFLHMLEEGATLGVGSESDPDSPRARLLKQFEQEALLEGGLGLELGFPDVPELQLDDVTDDVLGGRGPGSVAEASGISEGGDAPEKFHSAWDSEDDTELASIMEAAESELQRATQSIKSKTRAKMLEDAETEALMQEWGLNEKAFTGSPPKSKHRYDGASMPKHQEAPPLLQGLGSAVPVKDGGSLRSMSPATLQTSNGNGKLVMQVSKPVVVPAEMGSGTVDILRQMASMGMENMAVQAMTAMPLEDVTGQTVEQIAMEGLAAGKALRNGRLNLESSSAKIPLATGRSDRRYGTHSQKDTAENFFTLEDLAPMAMQQIEALAVEGLKIQTDMTEEDAPYTLNAFSLEDTETRHGNVQSSIGSLKGVTGFPLMKGARAADDGDISSGENGLMSMSISLDEWMRLDAGIVDEVEISNDTLAIMAAHHAVHKDLVVNVKDEQDKSGGGKQAKGAAWGNMGNTLTIAMLVQLRDPLRNNEAVGVPMMALVQAERVMVPPKPKLGRPISMRNSKEDDSAKQQEPQFKITGVHMAGLKVQEDDKKKAWGSPKELQSGSRWLTAHGMGKISRSHPLLKSKPAAVPTPERTKGKQGESFWSISSRVQGSGSKWKEMLKPKPVRNPDVMFRNQSMRKR